MQVFIKKPSIQFYPGVRVTRDTVLSYESEEVCQSVKDLVLHSVTKRSGEGFESVNDTTIKLCEGDVLIFEDGGRGYIKPVEGFCTVAEAIDELACLQEFGGDGDVRAE